MEEYESINYFLLISNMNHVSFIRREGVITTPPFTYVGPMAQNT